MSEKLTEKVAFDFIRYANCWEDADLLLEGLNPEPGSKILSIGSAGDNSFSLLTTDPELVVAIDVNKIQLYLIELKKVSIQQLSHEKVLAFLGFRKSASREETFNALKGFLDEETRQYWEKNLTQIKAGIISQGKFEKYFQYFSRKILPWIHTARRTANLLKQKSAQEQQEYYQKHWNTWRWRLLFKIFFSKYVMGKYGRDPQFLKEVKVSVGEAIFLKAQAHLRSVGAQHNFILRYNLTGSFGNLLPHYLQPANFQKIKENLHKLHIREGFAEDAVSEFGTFHAMNLSNIFEYMDPELFVKTTQKLVESTVSGGKIAYWNLMVPRSISEVSSGKAVYLQELSQKLTTQDKGFFYNRFIIDQVQ